MSVFLGFILHDTPSRDRYSKALTEIEQIMLVHKQDLQITNNEYQLKFKISDTSFSLPKNPYYLATTYYRINGEGDLQLAIELIWDCLCVLKESFPSKLELYQENLDEFSLHDWESELLRRQLNNLQNRIQSTDNLTKDEIEDVFAVLNICQQLKQSKGIEICLSLINSELVQPLFLMNLPQKYLEYLHKLIENGQILHKQMANSITKKLNKIEITSIEPNNQDKQLMSVIHNNPKYDQFNSNSSIIFQLKETTEIDRICFYFDYILNKNKTLLVQIPQTIYNIIDKYYDGYYGLDQSQLTKYNVFHTLLNQIIVNYDMDQQITQKILAINDEGLINWLNGLIQMHHKQIYTLYPQSLLQLYKNQVNGLLINHKQNVYQIIVHKLGLNSNANKSDQQKIYENIEEIRCISKQLAQFIEAMII